MILIPTTKTQAVEMFGGVKSELAAALGISRQAINAWPEQLTERQINEIVGASIRRKQDTNGGVPKVSE